MGTGDPAVLVPRRVCQIIDVCNYAFGTVGGTGNGGSNGDDSRSSGATD